jgi:hypothetical protein
LFLKKNVIKNEIKDYLTANFVYLSISSLPVHFEHPHDAGTLKFLINLCPSSHTSSTGISRKPVTEQHSHSFNWSKVTDKEREREKKVLIKKVFFPAFPFQLCDLHGSNLVPLLHEPVHSVIPLTPFTFLQMPCIESCVFINPIVALSASDSGKQFVCASASKLHLWQHPSLYSIRGSHVDTSGQTGGIVETKIWPSLILHSNVVQLSSLVHVSLISYSLFSTMHLVFTHSPQHLLGMALSS